GPPGARRAGVARHTRRAPRVLIDGQKLPAALLRTVAAFSPAKGAAFAGCSLPGSRVGQSDRVLVLRVAFAGTPEFALPALAALHAHHELVGVLTPPDRPSGRGRHLTASAVKTAALAHHLPLAQPPQLRTEAARAGLAAWHPDVLVVVA